MNDFIGDPGIPFEPFPKMARLNRDIVVTEKIDGTNAQVVISDDGELLAVGSRKRWIWPGSDNFGFAAWVNSHRGAFEELGPGRHFGEWYGKGIQRGYGLVNKRFALFNTSRWNEDTVTPLMRSAEIGAVPVLYEGPYSQEEIVHSLNLLRWHGSRAAPFGKPEGVVVFHTASNSCFKVTLENDESPKSLAIAA